MQFYLGTHQPGWLARAGVPLFVSHRRLRGYTRLPRARASWALDSGGFSELSMFGEWQTDPSEYVYYVDRYDREVGNLNWAAPQDWMCEPWIVAKTGRSVREHQERTVENFVLLERLWEAQQQLWLRPCDRNSCPFMPVLQGWDLADYWTCVDLYAQAGVRLADYPLVGLGSVCRRQATGEIETIVRSLGAVLPIHGFGVKTEGIGRYARWLTSADSMAWSVAGRREPGCSAGHRSEANCQRYALAWRERVIDAADRPGAEQPALFATQRTSAVIG
jgi:hypothetical protein